MFAVTRKIHNPVNLSVVWWIVGDRARWSRSSLLSARETLEEQIAKIKKKDTSALVRERVTESPDYSREWKKKEKEKITESEIGRRHVEWVAEFNRFRPFNHTCCSSLKHRWPIDEGEKQNWRILNKPSLTMQRFCARPCVRIVYFRECFPLSIYRSIDRSIDRRKRAWREIDSTSLRTLFRRPQEIIFSNNELRERWIHFFIIIFFERWCIEVRFTNLRLT